MEKGDTDIYDNNDENFVVQNSDNRGGRRGAWAAGSYRADRLRSGDMLALL